MVTASRKSTLTICPLFKPNTIPYKPDIAASAACSPKTLANTRSLAVGEPPRCTKPKVVKRVETPVFSCNSLAKDCISPTPSEAKITR